MALTYTLALIALLVAMATFALILPAYQNATEAQFVSFQPDVSHVANDCAGESLRTAQFTRNVYIQFALLSLALALLNGAACGWLRAQWRKR